ncbi:hypothetical protein NPIL_316501 [Nephila pilipes]|uniref:Uncharacterized protein n=1 Tax=Nephila pilipes TaxID=299642 RepID=A0A8X6ULN5_NEPPI|nr:hypothetical protein NPIL_316501 [Nephila pilipes]
MELYVSQNLKIYTIPQNLFSLRSKRAYLSEISPITPSPKNTSPFSSIKVHFGKRTILGVGKNKKVAIPLALFRREGNPTQCVSPTINGAVTLSWPHFPFGVRGAIVNRGPNSNGGDVSRPAVIAVSFYYFPRCARMR